MVCGIGVMNKQAVWKKQVKTNEKKLTQLLALQKERNQKGSLAQL